MSTKVKSREALGIYSNAEHFKHFKALQGILTTAINSGNLAAKASADNLIQYFVAADTSISVRSSRKNVLYVQCQPRVRSIPGRFLVVPPGYGAGDRGRGSPPVVAQGSEAGGGFLVSHQD